jgi:DNA-binding CsgD family transcriptional regulator
MSETQEPGAIPDTPTLADAILGAAAPQPQPPPMSRAEKAAKVLEMSRAGKSRATIAAEVKISLPTIDDIRKKAGFRAPVTSKSGRLKRAYAERDAALAGVGSTESRKAKPEDMPRGMGDNSGEIYRQPLDERQINAYDLPDHLKKPGWDYKWEVTSVMGQPALRSLMRDAMKSGWRAERAGDWLGYADPLAKPDDAVEEGGQILMGRPIHLSHQAHTEMYNRAKSQERDRMQAAAGGVDARGGEGLANVRGIRVGGQSLQVELAAGSGPIQHKQVG